MEVIALTMFVSLCLVACSLLLLAFTLRQRSHEQSDRLALLPMEDDHAAIVHAAVVHAAVVHAAVVHAPTDHAPTDDARKTEK